MTILVFAGAGASAAIDPKLYPTTEEFFNRISDSIKRDHIFVEIEEFFKKNNINPIDIEHVLGALEEIRSYLWAAHDTSSITGWIASRNSFGVINSNLDTTSLHRYSSEAISHCSNLISRIHELFYHFYAAPPAEAKLDTWIYFLKKVQEIDSITELFTTNYDIVLEHVIDYGKLNIDSGRIFDGRYTSLNTMLWGGPDLDYRRGRLTKLHGSVDWQRSGQSHYK